MKVLQLQVGQRLRIGEEIVLEIRRIRGRSCRISIHTPRSIHIDRDEVPARREADRAAGVMKQREFRS